MSELIDAIIPDVEMKMTSDLSRAFKLCDCDPNCHCCGKGIEIGSIFKLSYIKSRGEFFSNYSKKEVEEDEMLCEKCSVEDLVQYKIKLWNAGRQKYENRNSGYTRIHR